MAQTTGRTIQERDNEQRKAEEGNARLAAKAALFYADKGMVDSTDLGWLQSAFDLLTGLFDRVGILTNIQKTTGMVCNPCRKSGVRADGAYAWRMAGEGHSFKDIQRERVL